MDSRNGRGCDPDIASIPAMVSGTIVCPTNFPFIIIMGKDTSQNPGGPAPRGGEFTA